MNPIYENDWVKLYQGDCLEIMPELDITFDACITDPPYGTTACKWDSVIPFELMWNNLKRLVKSSGAICLFGSEPFSSALRMSNINYFRYDWIWHKNFSGGFALAKKQPMKYHEIISVFYLKQCVYNPQMQRYADSVYKRFKNGEKVNRQKEVNNSTNQIQSGLSFEGEKTINFDEGKYPESVQTFSGVENCNGIRVHPTQKPVPLIEYLIKTYTNENEYVLDFTSGSGTMGVACMETNRKCVLIEKEEKYCEITIKRLKDKEKEIAERLF